MSKSIEEGRQLAREFDEIMQKIEGRFWENQAKLRKPLEGKGLIELVKQVLFLLELVRHPQAIFQFEVVYPFRRKYRIAVFVGSVY